MKCNSCGATVADTAKFCEYCGTKLTVPIAEPVAEPITEPVIVQDVEPVIEPVSEPVPEPAAETVPVAVVEASIPVDTGTAAIPAEQEEIPSVKAEMIPKRPNAAVLAGRSGIFAAANVLFTINTVLTVLFSVGGLLLGAGGAVAAVAALSEYFGVDISGVIELLTGDTVVIALLIAIGVVILANIPSILLNIGLCSTRSACKKSNGENIRPTGLKLIRFITVVGIVLVSLVLAAALCASVFFIIGDPSIRAIGITALTLTAITVIVFAFCYAKIMSTLNNAIHTAEGRCEKKASTFLGVLCIIVAVFSLVNIIACLALIFYAVTLFKYNSIINSRSAE